MAALHCLDLCSFSLVLLQQRGPIALEVGIVCMDMIGPILLRMFDFHLLVKPVVLPRKRGLHG